MNVTQGSSTFGDDFENFDKTTRPIFPRRRFEAPTLLRIIQHHSEIERSVFEKGEADVSHFVSCTEIERYNIKYKFIVKNESSLKVCRKTNM